MNEGGEGVGGMGLGRLGGGGRGEGGFGGNGEGGENGDGSGGGGRGDGGREGGGGLGGEGEERRVQVTQKPELSTVVSDVNCSVMVPVSRQPTQHDPRDSTELSQFSYSRI